MRSAFRKAFPGVPDGWSQAQTERFVMSTIDLDRVKSQCGAEAALWIDSVMKLYGRKAGR